MENNQQGIERTEITTPFDLIQQQQGGDPRKLDLNNPNPQQAQTLIPPKDDPNLEPVDGDDPTGDDPQGDPNDGGDPNGDAGQGGDDPSGDDPAGGDPSGEGDNPAGDGGDGDDPDGDPGDDYDVQIKANLAKYAAEALKAQGGLPDDFEITDEITEADLDAAYVSYKEETLRNQILQEEKQRLADEEGLTPEMIEEIKLKYYGIQDQQLQQLKALEYLSTYKFDENADSFAEDAKSFLTSYYALKKINESRIEKLVKTDLEDENLLTIITDAQGDLHNDFIDLDQDVKNKVKDAEVDKKRKRKENQDKVNSLLDAGTISGVQYTAEEMQKVKRALFEKTEIVVGPDGKKYRATLYYKKRLEAAQDLEKDLQQKINFILGGDTKALKRKEQEKTTKKILNKLNNYVDVSVKKPGKKKPKAGDKNTSQGIQRVEIN